MNRLNCLASSYASSYLLAPLTSSSSLRLFLANLPLTIGMSKQQRQRRQRQRQYLPSINLPSLAHSSLYGKSGAQFFLHLCLYLNPVLRCGHLSEQCGQCVPELVQCGSSSIANTGTQTTPRTPFPLPPPLFILSLPLLTAAELRVWRNAHTCAPFFSSKSFSLSFSSVSGLCTTCPPLAWPLPLALFSLFLSSLFHFLSFSQFIYRRRCRRRCRFSITSTSTHTHTHIPNGRKVSHSAARAASIQFAAKPP